MDPNPIREVGLGDAIVLVDPRETWRVERGRFVLFSGAVREASPSFPRRRRIEVGVGGALFGLGADPTAAGIGLIAVALESSALRVVAPDHSESTELARAWRIAWEASVGALSANPDDLQRFHLELLERLAELGAREHEQDQRRAEAQARLEREAAERASATLASAAGRAEKAIVGGSGLEAAARRVAAALGIDFETRPTWSSTADDPVESLARAAGIRIRRVRLHEGWWRQDCGALLGFHGPDLHPVALIPAGTRRYEIHGAPATAASIVDETIAHELAPHAWVLYRPLPAHAERLSTLARFALAGRSGDLVRIGLSAVAATVLGMLVPIATGWVVDQAIPQADDRLLVELGLGLLVAALGAAAFRLFQGLAMLRMETVADAVVQPAVMDRLLGLRPEFFRRHSTGELQQAVAAVGSIRARFGGVTLRAMFSGIALLLNLALLLHYSPGLAWVALIVAVLSGAAAFCAGFIGVKFTRRILECDARIFSLVVQLIQAIPKLRVAAAEGRGFARWADEFAPLVRLEIGSARVRDALICTNIVIATAGTIAVLGLASTLVRPASGAATLSTGQFLAFQTAYGVFVGAVVSLSNTAIDILTVGVLRERARPLLEAEPEAEAHRADPGRLAGRIEVEGVVFQFHEDGPRILDGIDLHAEPGEFVAVVGPSGSGKSTLFRLLLGFETPRAGTIRYDGRELGGIDVLALRRQFGVVLQGGRIGAGSIFDSIAAGAQLTLEEAHDAVRAAGFEEDVAEMPMGLHTVVAEGGINLSGGQRQRLLIARALARRPRILFFDEATSALDNRTQAVVTQSLSRLGVTRVVIAHRLSTIRDADRIYVIGNGRLVEEGGYEALIAAGGQFSRLAARQTA